MTKTPNILAGAAVVVIAAGIAVPVTMGGDRADPTFKTLHQPARAQDRLPAEPADAGGPLGAIDPDSARLVGNIDGHDVYMAPGPDDTICLLDRDEQGSFGGACLSRKTMKTRPAFTAWRDGGSGEWTVAVPVADAYDSVVFDRRAFPVRNNVALGHAPAAKGTIELSRDATLEEDVDLGDSTPAAGG